MKKNYREPLQQYLERHNINQSEFADWAGVPLWAVRSEVNKYAERVLVHLLQRHPLTTPEIPSDLYQRVCLFRAARNLQWSELADRWGVGASTIQMWRTVRPNVGHWRQFVASGGYAEVMQEYAPTSTPTPPITPTTTTPKLRTEQRFAVSGKQVFHIKHGWSTATAIVNGWVTVQCRDGIERYYLLSKNQCQQVRKNL